MAYCTAADMAERYGESALVTLTDRKRPQGAIDAGVLQRAIDDACAEIDLYLQGRYRLPLAKIPAALKQMACMLAFGNLHVSPKEGKEHPALLAAASQRDVLRLIAAGRLTLGLTQDGTAVEGTGAVQISQGRNDWARRW